MKVSVGSLVLGLVVGVVASGAMVAVAAVPDSTTGSITACYAKKGGAVRVINAENGAKCRKDERRLAWNQRGPAGPRGATGPQGAQGASGSALAYAYVEDYTVEAAGPTEGLNVPSGQARGITTSMVSRPQLGVYCFELSSLGDVNVVQATAEIEYNDLAESDKVVSAKVLDDDDFGFGCPADSDMVVVMRDLSDGVPVNGFFYVTLN
jgi:hypothetical protein